jgi:4-hydroxybenzoate polyprenyltransferase
MIAAALYFYATSLKQMVLIGNIVVAALLSCSVIIIGIFDLFPVITPENQPMMANLFSILLDFAVFAFMINFIREIVKDLEDVNGDYNQGMSTLPIVLGISRTAKITFGLSFIPILVILVYINTYLIPLLYATIYMFLFILGPLFYFMIKIWTAKKQKEFHSLSLLLKWILFFGILSVLVISLNIKYNA